MRKDSYIMNVNRGRNCYNCKKFGYLTRYCVVATTRRNGTRSLLTSAKLANGLSRSGDYKRTQQGALAAFIYYIYTWLLVRATTISIQPLSPCSVLMSSTCVFHKATMLPTCALTSYL